ncbi:hypothetical protein QBC35DRAFT_449453 [Podospora australis]|uniref:Myb-like domain-containing protein n=1 Tax=Podospora australis TaxID=1536484 RepID=A0AAN6WXY6_9PEZI|nr:hypothetical protein QBC35DRAFT_449453 [Podospora australis]
MSNKNWNDRADKDLFFTILSVKNIGVISGGEWTTIGNHMRSIGYGFTNEGCRQHFQGLRRAQNKADANIMAGLEHLNNKTPNKADPTLNPITRRPGPGRGRPRKTPQKGEGAADATAPDGSVASPSAASAPDSVPAPGVVPTAGMAPVPGMTAGPAIPPNPQPPGVHTIPPGMHAVPGMSGMPPAPINQAQPQPHTQGQFQLQSQPQAPPQTPAKKPRARKSRAKDAQAQPQVPARLQPQTHAQVQAAQAQAQAHQAHLQAQAHAQSQAAQGHMPPGPVNMVASRVAPPAQMEGPGDVGDDDDDDLAVDPSLGDGEHPSKRPRLDDSQGTSSMDDEAMLSALAAHNAPTPADYIQEFNYGDA